LGSLLFQKETVMNMMKSFLAIAIIATSASVSAQFVHIPDFPTKKASAEPVQVENSEKAVVTEQLEVAK
jgi:hypothetical protein